MSILTKTAMTVDDYFEWELLQERKHEYIDGEVIEMPGVSNKHSLITMNITLTLGNAVDRSRFMLHTAELRIQISPTRYVYPDLTLVRGDAIFADASEYNLMNPVFVVEVTSPSSITRDRQAKLEYYYSLPSIEACLIVDQHRVCAELYTRGDEDWHRQVFTELSDDIPLTPLNCDLQLNEVYRGIAFEAL